MAHIIPYGDPLAYGKFAGNIVFRRYRGGTTIITKSKPRYRRTPAQAAVRNKFKDAAEGYKKLTSKSRDFYRARAPQVGLCVRDLYFRGYMKGWIPTTLPGIDMKLISKMVIFKTAGSKQGDFDIYIEAAEKAGALGQIILWCKMESLSDVQSPTEGPAGAITGTVTYPPMEFNNGGYINDGSGTIKFPALPANNLHLRGMHGFYWQPSFSSTSGEFYSLWNLPGVVAEEGLFCWYYGAQHAIIIEIVRTDFMIQYSFPVTFAADELMHILCLWDTDNPAGSRARLWKGTDEITPNIAVDNPFPAADTYSTLAFDNFPYNNYAGYDNTKLYDGVDDLNEALANIYNEGLPLEPTGNWIPYASVEDASNTFTQLNTIDYQTNQRVHIHEKGNVPVDIPFRYLFTLDYQELDDTPRTAAVRLPKLYLAPLSHTYLYFSNDWSDYWDTTLWHLACTDNL